MGRKTAAAAADTVLVVEDEADFAEEFIAPIFRPTWNVQLAYSVPHALDTLDSIQRLPLALVDLNIPGGRPFSGEALGGGFQVIERINERFPDALVVVVTAHDTPHLINTAQRLGAEFMVKQDYLANLGALVERLRAPTGPNRRVIAFARRMQREHGLTERQLQIVVLAVCGRRNVEIAQELSISVNTLKAHSRDILRACGVSRLADIARSFWRSDGS